MFIPLMLRLASVHAGFSSEGDDGDYEGSGFVGPDGVQTTFFLAGIGLVCAVIVAAISRAIDLNQIKAQLSAVGAKIQSTPAAPIAPRQQPPCPTSPTQPYRRTSRRRPPATDRPDAVGPTAAATPGGLAGNRTAATTARADACRRVGRQGQDRGVLDALSPARRGFVLGLCGLVLLAVIAAVRDRADPPRAGPEGRVTRRSGAGVAGARVRRGDHGPGGARRQPARRPDGTPSSSCSRATGPATSACRPRCWTGRCSGHSDEPERQSVDLVGYSAGGVTARLWARDRRRQPRPTDGDPRLAPPRDRSRGAGRRPHAGQMPRGMAAASDRQRPVARLNAKDKTPEGPRWVSIWSTEDQTVVPPDSDARGRP